MYHDLIYTEHHPLAVPSGKVRRRLRHGEPPIPLGEPTVLNKERTGQRTEAPRRRTPPVREVLLVATNRDRVRQATMVNRCEPVQGS